MDVARPKRKPRGFTLIQLGVVLACAAVLAAVVMPDFIETQRNKMAVKSAEEVAVLFDAARWFYLTPPPGRASGWPGQHDPTNCTLANYNFDMVKARFELYDGGYYATNPTDTTASYSNPWTRQYEFDILPSTLLGGDNVCLFRISTNVPVGVAKAFIANLPQAGCENGAALGLPPPVASLTQTCGLASAAPGPGWVRCCGAAPPPMPPGTISWTPSAPTNRAFCPSGKKLDNATGTLKCL